MGKHVRLRQNGRKRNHKLLQKICCKKGSFIWITCPRRKRTYSDIDLAIGGAKNFDHLYADLKYNDFTLLDMDIINLDEPLSEALREDIRRDGHILYEGAWGDASKN